MEKKIELSPMQITSYWWINMIRFKLRELEIEGTSNKDEKKFLELFYNFSEKDWRNIYLKLTDLINEDINNYELTRDILNPDAFSQDTCINGHDRLNEELSLILDKNVPDIRLSSNSSKDSVIYTDILGVVEWYKSCGTIRVSNQYDSTYILNGDESELHFYNLMLATIFHLDKMDSSFKKFYELRKKFCKKYMEDYDIDLSYEEIVEEFNRLFERACSRKILLGDSHSKMYFCRFRDIDCVGLDEYSTQAREYASEILNGKNKKLVLQ